MQLTFDFPYERNETSPPKETNLQQEKREFSLIGLDGGNPLGFLAALGALKAASDAMPAGEWRISWRQDRGPWTPTLAGITSLDENRLVDELAEHLKTADTQALSISKNLDLSPEQFRNIARQAQESAGPGNRRYADFIAALGCETATDRKGQKIQDTALRTMSGAGHQHFLEFMLKTATDTTAGQLRRSMLQPWLQEDKGLGLRWDPSEDRRYALRWDDPSGIPATTERGANRLAIEALPLLPTAVISTAAAAATLETTGFQQERGIGCRFTWPIWTCPIDVSAATSAIRLQEIQKEHPNHDYLSSMGIAAVYRCRRITVGNFRSFTSAAPV